MLRLSIAIALAGCYLPDGGSSARQGPVQPVPPAPGPPVTVPPAVGAHAPCPPQPNLDSVQSTLSGMYGGAAYGGNGRSRFVVDVADFMTLGPIEGISVQISHDLGPCDRNTGCRPMHAHPPGMERMQSTTDAHGRVMFDVPDLAYQLWIPPSANAAYLSYSSTYDLGARKCHELVIEATKVDRGTKYFVAYLVPTSMLAVQTQDQAIALAEGVPEIHGWLASHGQYQLSVTGGPPSSPTMWQVRWGTATNLKRLVLVNAFDGSAGVGGRWTD